MSPLKEQKGSLARAPTSAEFCCASTFFFSHLRSHKKDNSIIIQQCCAGSTLQDFNHPIITIENAPVCLYSSTVVHHGLEGQACKGASVKRENFFRDNYSSTTKYDTSSSPPHPLSLESGPNIPLRLVIERRL